MNDKTEKSEIAATYLPDLFAGKRVLVSGGTSGIGLAIAKGFAALGADVVATGSNAAKVEAGQAEAGERLRFAVLDVRDSAAVSAFAKGFDRLDVLVNAQGIGRGEAEHQEAVFLDVIEVNLNSVMRLSTAFRPLLAKTRGSIVNIASMLSYLVEPEVPAYTASKTGILGLTRALAHAYGPDGVRVNAISPGYHKTDMTKGLWTQPKSHDLIADHSALKRWGSVDDLVGAAVFLASPAASFVTGADLPVDGGYVCGNTIR
ncbi:SDR family oxidoreductase [Shinella zoogloeoides]|uniref:SDR family NAD(P)-dependent oxidoreductase n=1 Tax=Shinella zoogloeoides TaxID=352475 RepID=UPI0028AE797F|nr:SDR family oxidoreductase [Shinella zoogloeoides]